MAAFPLSLFFSPPLFFDVFLFYSRPLSHVFRLPLIPPFSGGGSPSWSSNCYIVGKRGSRVSFNRSGRNATTAVLWDRVPAFLGMSIGSAYTSGRYVFLVAFISGRLLFNPVFCSYHIAEKIRAGAEPVAWPTWCLYVLNTSPPVSGLASEMS